MDLQVRERERAFKTKERDQVQKYLEHLEDSNIPLQLVFCPPLSSTEGWGDDQHTKVGLIYEINVNTMLTYQAQLDLVSQSTT